MAIDNAQVEVGTTAVPLWDADIGGVDVSLRNLGDQVVWLGDEAVDETSGHPIYPDEQLGISITTNDVLYAAAESGESTVSVFRAAVGRVPIA